jgi:predicted ATPase
MTVLLALEIKNFKSISDAVIRFGPLTCFVGHNGVGKSNLFDAIHFLSRLAEVDIHEATLDVRRTAEGSGSPLDLVYERKDEHTIELSADMIVPSHVVDDFGQETKSSTTLLRYDVHLQYSRESDRLVVTYESLQHHRLGEFKQLTGFESTPAFRESVAVGSRRGGPLISTDVAQGAIRLHGDGGSRGRPLPVGRSPLTVLGGTNTFDYPTVLAAKRELASWKLLHLEPSSMRSPDPRAAEPHVSASGGHLAATLAGILRNNPAEARQELVNRLRDLNADVHDVDVYQDEVRDQLALRARVTGVDTWLFSRSLSDGTLRYIALAIMLMDVHDRGLLALEEPENGVHPSRAPDLVDLLYDYAVDPAEPTGEDNPLRQVVLNTHSPEVARRLRIDDLVFVERGRRGLGRSTTVFRPIEGTWRASDNSPRGASPAPKDRQSVADFIGGAPVLDELAEQLRFDLGTAS